VSGPVSGASDGSLGFTGFMGFMSAPPSSLGRR
jgi:hypothetical protein